MKTTCGWVMVLQHCRASMFPQRAVQISATTSISIFAGSDQVKRKRSSTAIQLGHLALGLPRLEQADTIFKTRHFLRSRVLR